MTATPYICRPCLLLLQQSWKQALPRRQLRWITEKTHNAREEAAKEPNGRNEVYNPATLFRKYDPFLGSRLETRIRRQKHYEKPVLTAGQLRAVKRWNKRFSVVRKIVEEGRPMDGAEMTQLLGHGLPFAEALTSRDDVEAMKEEWHSMDEFQRRLRWPGILLYAMASNPDKTLFILLATADGSVGREFAVKDILGFLIQRISSLPAELQLERADQLVNALLSGRLDGNGSTTLAPLTQKSIFLLMNSLSLPRLKDLYLGLKRRGQWLHAQTYTQLASRFAKDEQYKGLAMEILRDVVRTRKGFDINSPVGASLCTSILAGKAGSTPHAQDATFEKLLSLGMNPNIITWTAVVRNLCTNGDLDAALEVLDVLLRHKHEPDAHTYSVLLNGAKLCGRYDVLTRVFLMAVSQRVHSPVVYDDVIHAYATAAVRDAQELRLKPGQASPAFSALVQLYLEFFEPGPLQQLLPVPLPLAAPHRQYNSYAALRQWPSLQSLQSLLRHLKQLEPRERPLQPTAYTLSLMAASYIRSLPDPDSVMTFYSHYCRLVRTGDPAALLIVDSHWTMVHDTVIKCLLEWPGTLGTARSIVNDMLRDTGHRAWTPFTPLPSSTPPTELPRRQHPHPSVYTWSILLAGCMRPHHRQHQQEHNHHHRRRNTNSRGLPHQNEAERLVELMRTHGFTPSLTTWNTLVAGYARLQDDAGVLSALRRLERAGHTPDEHTARAYALLRDKRQLLRRLEAAAGQAEALDDEDASGGDCVADDATSAGDEP